MPTDKEIYDTAALADNFENQKNSLVINPGF
jgi:hypothetical protein